MFNNPNQLVSNQFIKYPVAEFMEYHQKHIKELQIYLNYCRFNFDSCLVKDKFYKKLFIAEHTIANLLNTFGSQYDLCEAGYVFKQYDEVINYFTNNYKIYAQTGLNIVDDLNQKRDHIKTRFNDADGVMKFFSEISKFVSIYDVYIDPLEDKFSPHSIYVRYCLVNNEEEPVSIRNKNV